MFSAMLVLATASAPRPRPTGAPPRPGPPAARLQSPAARADRTRRDPSRVGGQQIWAAIPLGPAGPVRRAHPRLRLQHTQTASDCEKEGLDKGRVPRICAAGRVLVPRQRGGGGARVQGLWERRGTASRHAGGA